VWFFFFSNIRKNGRPGRIAFAKQCFQNSLFQTAFHVAGVSHSVDGNVSQGQARPAAINGRLQRSGQDCLEILASDFFKFVQCGAAGAQPDDHGSGCSGFHVSHAVSL